MCEKKNVKMMLFELWRSDDDVLLGGENGKMMNLWMMRMGG